MNATTLRTRLALVPLLATLCLALSSTASAGSPYRNGHYFGEEIEVGTHSTSFDVRNGKVKKFYFVTEGNCTKVATVSIDVSSADTSTETCSAKRKIDVRIGGT